MSKVTGDRFAGEWPREALRAHGLDYEVCDRDKSALYLALLASVNSRTVELPDDATLVRELCALERRRGPSGRDRVDHPPGAHDDAANCIAGLAHELLARPRGEQWEGLYPEPAATGAFSAE